MDCAEQKYVGNIHADMQGLLFQSDFPIITIFNLLLNGTSQFLWFIVTFDAVGGGLRQVSS